ncbi:MAG: DUF3842 family protein [Nitrospirae bacterium]|nr:DUF3842 family protein [Nitrospirota bacterium]
MVIAVIDGQGGGIGSEIIKKLRDYLPEEIEIIALGTNAIATSSMMRAGANKGASGENAIIQSIGNVQLIIGPLSIVLANSMMGEMTVAMASAISTTRIRKILLPIGFEHIELVGTEKEPIPHMILKLVDRVNLLIGSEKRK